jgi:hypothetical protein
VLPVLFTPFVQRTPFVHRNDYAGGSDVAAAWVQLYRALTKRTTSSMSLKRAMGAMGPNTSSCATPLPVGVLRCLGDAACDAEISHSTPPPQNVRHARHSLKRITRWQLQLVTLQTDRPTRPTRPTCITAERPNAARSDWKSRTVGSIYLKPRNPRLSIAATNASKYNGSRAEPLENCLSLPSCFPPATTYFLHSSITPHSRLYLMVHRWFTHRVSLEVAAPSRGEQQQRDEALNSARIRRGQADGIGPT